MDVNVIIDNLTQRIASLTKENAFLVAQLKEYEQRLEQNQTKGVEENVE
ncbi:hypothetical protein QNH48_15035 [Neobacillus sp. YX16]|nr:hypothetical protein [Neobacillus sp. YX16]WHZ05854.1 hypothetical protein QNH48_15035 [Neobacillus sp. YX16]